MSVPAWGLTIAYWLHMLATVIWIGGLAALSILVLPAARRSLDGKAYAAFLADLQRRFDPLAWFSLLVLGGTGLFQMSANPHYRGFLTITDVWAYAILIKHLLFLGMAGLSIYLTWVIVPGLRRISLQQALAAQGRPVEAQSGENLSRQETRLLRLNLLLGVLVLALTAIARAA
jgi:uncharacterized membrane protein